eukprot:jgi/Psemu1/284196/fgenesh1_pg.44_\
MTRLLITTTSALFLSAVLLSGPTEAFTTHVHTHLSNTHQHQHLQQSSALRLLPDQGNQLVAAYNALSESQLKETKATTTAAATNSSNKAPIEVSKDIRVVADEAEAAPRSKWRESTIAASKSLLSKIFQGPAVLHPLELKFGRPEDVCYYPMVGFRYIEGVDTVLPTKASASCSMPTRSQREEELFGWFSSSCKLDLFSDDVCVNPIGGGGKQQ